jgi:protein-disulfide isomerase
MLAVFSGLPGDEHRLGELRERTMDRCKAHHVKRAKRIAEFTLIGCLFIVVVTHAGDVETTLPALGHQPTLGSANAPVRIVEFSDFQCSFCKRFWAESLPRLKKNYIEKGQVRFTYRHFAVLGKISEQAANAAECAREQGKFWEYHDTLFANQGMLAFTESKLNHYARELKLNGRTFGECLATGRHLKKVARETAAAASNGVRGTPSFFVNDRLVVGAQPIEVFRTVVEEELKAKSFSGNTE